jgi:opacity protein-like surface antigen
MMRAIGIAVCGAVASAALADEGEGDVHDRFGPYMALSGGYTLSSSATIKSKTTESGIELPSADMSLDPGYAVIGAFGFCQGAVRGEFELSYRNNNVSDMSVSHVDLSDVSGHLSTFTMAANGYYDFQIARPLFIYVGGGAGLAFVNLDGSGVAPGGTFSDVSSNQGALVLQFMAGLDLQVARNLHLTAGYRLYSLFGANIAVVSNNGSGTILVQGESQYQPILLNGFEVGMRYDF